MKAVASEPVPPAAVTDTATVPVPDGSFTVSFVELVTCTVVPGVEPKSTAVTVVKLVPVTVTVVPPAAGPLAGLTLVTVGAGT